MTQQFRNVSPLGALDIPAIGRVVEAGEVFDVEPALVDFFHAQPDNFAAVKAPAKPKTPKTRNAKVVKAEPDPSPAPAESTDTAEPAASIAEPEAVQDEDITKGVDQ